MTGPEPKPADTKKPEEETEEDSGETTGGRLPRHENPTRYGDWEISGRCVDF